MDYMIRFFDFLTQPHKCYCVSHPVEELLKQIKTIVIREMHICNPLREVMSYDFVIYTDTAELLRIVDVF